jgi:hypothetical protein
MRDFPRKWRKLLVRYYYQGIILVAAGMVVLFLLSTPPADWLPLGAMTILLFSVVTEMLPVSLQRGGTQVTVGFPIVCTVIAQYGTVPAIVVDSLPTLLAGVMLNRTYPLPTA